jgi:NAD(P)-dependent dehydrogenase (short-subunit alcohol dehydrogenase family)
MTREISGAVVVVTGASSGIGRATALEFASRGACVVVAARRDEPLQTLVVDCEAVSGRAFAVVADVTDEAAVQGIARAAIERFGRLDVWVNNAAVAGFGRIDEMPSDVYDGILRTNIFGYVYGARAAIRQFRAQGSGALINVSSVNGKVGGPMESAYVASKFAVTGLSESLRSELRHEPGISVSTILPASIDTPLFQHMASYVGRAPKPLNPIYDAETVAAAIVECARSPKREVMVGGVGPVLTLTRRLSPRLHEHLFGKQVEIDHFRDEPTPPTAGNVLSPMPEGTDVSGGWKDGSLASSPRAAWAGAAAVAGLGVVLAALTRWGASKTGSRRPEAAS